MTPDWTEIYSSAEGAARVRPLGPNTWEITWSDPVPGGLDKALEAWFENTGPARLVHFCPPGDYSSLRQARALGFRAEGSESWPGGDVAEELWRSARISEEIPLDPAEQIDGSRPSHLVDEFHEVYDLPSNIGPDFMPTVDFSRLGLRMSLIKEEFAELCGAVYGPQAEAMLLSAYEELPDENERDPVETADALGDLVYVVYGMALEAGIDLDRVLAEVHRSNLSKLMPDGSVKRRSDGKVLKGPNFSEPDIAGSMRGR